MKSSNVVWEPQKGSQALYMACPIFEVLYEGTRGPGKTDALLMDYCQHVGQGYGPAWRGVIFRPEYKELDDVIAKSKKWIPRIFPGAKWIDSAQKYLWRFPGGEELRFRAAKKQDDYWSYHGQEYPFVGWEELTNWPDLKLYLDMMTVCRSSTPGMPRKYRATANPWGRGHNAVKARFIDPAPRGTVIKEEYKGPNGEMQTRSRVAIHGTIFENKILLEADPDYLPNLLAIEEPNKRRAWLFGDWDVTSGGAIDDLWNRSKHIVQPFAIPPSWRVDRSFDWGSSKPFSVGWWAESDGTEIASPPPGVKRFYPKGTLFRIGEWYGWNGRPNEGMKIEDVEIGKGIKEREDRIKAAYKIADVKTGPADSSIFDADPGKDSIATGIASGYYGRQGKNPDIFTKADKSPGSRKNGLSVIRRLLKSGLSDRMEDAGLFVFNTCTDGFIRTVPTLPRDAVDPDDVDTGAEDHTYDDVRYRATAPKRSAQSVQLGAS